MPEHLPEWLDFQPLADRNARFQGSVQVADLERLQALLLGKQGLLSVTLMFGVDAASVRYLDCAVVGNLMMPCQRCLTPVEIPVNIRTRLGFVRNEEEEQGLPAGYEPLLVDAERVNSYAVIEDEIILATPALPMHMEAHGCRPMFAEQGVENTTQRENPFAQLKVLKGK